MKKKSGKIVFFGNERLATSVETSAPTLTKLIKAGYDIVAVIVSNDSTVSRKKRKLEVADIAQSHGIPIMVPKKLSDIRSELENLNADIGVLVAYGKMVPQSIINIFPHGIVNIHPSLLPLHRGPTPIESVILNGEEQTGVSLMKLVKAMDAGPIYAQKTITLNGNETKQQLVDTLLGIGSETLIETLPSIFESNINPEPQNESKATYDSLISKSDGLIDWQKSALRLEREIRAYAGWPGSRTLIANKEVIVTKARVFDGPASGSKLGEMIVQKNIILATTGSGRLAIEELKPAGKPAMSAKAFIAGYRNLI